MQLTQSFHFCGAPVTYPAFFLQWQRRNTFGVEAEEQTENTGI